jgi:3',5'-cyclic AMP phosphodiesterase CpdA
MKKRLVSLGLIVLGAAALATLGIVSYRRMAWVEEDLTPLSGYAVTQNYAALIRAVESQPVGPGGFRFVVLGDTRSNLSAARDVLAHAGAEKPAFILNTGDLVRRGTAGEYIAYHMPLVDRLNPIPLIPVPGNHEEGPNRDFAAFNAIYGADRFSFDYGPCRFVGVNNGDRDGLSGADLQFLESELSHGASGAEHKFVVLHIPPSFLGKQADSDGGRGFTWRAEAFRALMSRLHVEEVFLGHVHGYATEVVDGVRYTITGGGGAPLDKTLAEDGGVRNYVVVHVTSQGIKREVVRLLDGNWVRSEVS